MPSSERATVQASVAALPPGTAVEDVQHQEVSHVFHCMQCDLQFQVDMEVTSHRESHEIDEGVVRVRLDPRIRLERETWPRKAGTSEEY